MVNPLRKLLLLAVTFVAALSAASTASAETLYLVGQDFTGTNFLVAVDTASFDGGPAVAQSAVAITGLDTGSFVGELDCRRADGQLYAIAYGSSSSRLYTINRSTGAATPLGSTIAVNSFLYGFDVDPGGAQIRFTGWDGTNRRLNLNGTVAGTDTSLTYAAGDPNAGRAPSVYAIAYQDGPGGTTLFGLDTAWDSLVKTTAPSAGVLTTVGPTVPPIRPADDFLSFDITASGAAYALFRTYDPPPADAVTPYIVSIDLTTGTATHRAFPPSTYLTYALTGDCEASTAVRVSTFLIQRTNRGVNLRWRTASEADALGFNVYRQQNGKLLKLNQELIPSVFGGTASGHRYSWLDRSAARGPAKYRLQAVGLDGKRSWVGAANVAR
jgi:hypothetical protein